jgi:hypothetical protein
MTAWYEILAVPGRFLRAIVSDYEPQAAMIKEASRMTRWIDPSRPQAITPEQSRSADDHDLEMDLDVNMISHEIQYQSLTLVLKQPMMQSTYLSL